MLRVSKALPLGVRVGTPPQSLVGAVGGLSPQPGSWGVLPGSQGPGEPRAPGPATARGRQAEEEVGREMARLSPSGTVISPAVPGRSLSRGPVLDLCPLQLRGGGVSWGGRSGSQGNPDVAEKAMSTAPGTDQMWGAGGVLPRPWGQKHARSKSTGRGLSHRRTGAVRGQPPSGSVVGEGRAARGHFRGPGSLRTAGP